MHTFGIRRHLEMFIGARPKRSRWYVRTPRDVTFSIGNGGRGGEDTMRFLSEPVSLKVAVRKVTEKKERLTATTFKPTFFITLERKRAERSLHLI